MNGHGHVPFPPPTSTLAGRMPAVIRRALFATTFLCSTALWDVRGDELTGTPPPLPMAVGTEITANLVIVIFLFDRLASDTPRATSAIYLARVSDSSFSLYPVYFYYI